MPKTQRGYRCRDCGWESVVQVGRCSQCQAWNTLEAYTDQLRPASNSRGARTTMVARTLSLAAVPDDPGDRLLTLIPEFDSVLGGGLVPGSLVLVGGDPGIGKSTLMLQAAARLSTGGPVAYICGEESPRQVKLRATRLGIANAAVTLIPETNLDAALAAAEAIGASATIIDSIQSIYIEGLDTRSGGPAQL
ncbi:MAG: ATPase domain-containing protein, partial [Tepidiformaceae bacterium]